MLNKENIYSSNVFSNTFTKNMFFLSIGLLLITVFMSNALDYIKIYIDINYENELILKNLFMISLVIWFLSLNKYLRSYLKLLFAITFAGSVLFLLYVPNKTQIDIELHKMSKEYLEQKKVEVYEPLKEMETLEMPKIKIEKLETLKIEPIFKENSYTESVDNSTTIPSKPMLEIEE